MVDVRAVDAAGLGLDWAVSVGGGKSEEDLFWYWRSDDVLRLWFGRGDANVNGGDSEAKVQ